MVNPQHPETDKNIADVFPNLVDLQATLTRIKSGEPWKKNVRVALPLIKNPTFRVMLVALHDGAILPSHQADGAITVQVVEGRISFTALEEVIVIEQGQLVALPASEPHSVKAYEDSALLITVVLQKVAT